MSARPLQTRLSIVHTYLPFRLTFRRVRVRAAGAMADGLPARLRRLGAIVVIVFPPLFRYIWRGDIPPHREREA